jgi:hypothetical protein
MRMSCHFYKLRRRKAAQRAAEAAQGALAEQPKTDTTPADKTAQEAAPGRKKATAKKGDAK